ncbi:MAG TPA: biopolymer transporter ExbD [Allosphingosinicella sp.]|nr:biopolymer transporter ExbD [Allosphingosinicella sp.]
MAMTDATPVPAFAGPSILPSRHRGPAPRKRRFGLVRAAAEPGPVTEINTTPLIDVMLVLLIMFIITIPVATHEVPLDVPQPRPERAPERSYHQLDIAADGGLAWNGAPLPADQLPSRLLQLAADPATPELRLNPDSESRYGWIDQILAKIRFAGISRLGFIGNERYHRAF